MRKIYDGITYFNMLSSGNVRLNPKEKNNLDRKKTFGQIFDSGIPGIKFN